MVKVWIYPNSERLVESLRWSVYLSELCEDENQYTFFLKNKYYFEKTEVCLYMHIHVCICLENDRTLEAEAFLGSSP